MKDYETRTPISRRRFLIWISMAAGGLGAVVVGLPIVGFLFAPLIRREPQQWRPVGPVNQFKPGDTVEVSFDDASPLPWSGTLARTGAWLRRKPDGRFEAFVINCTHLGCPVNWLQDAELFMCPCHGGVYYADGTVAAGPPPRPLFQYQTRVNNGQVEILTGPIPIA